MLKAFNEKDSKGRRHAEKGVISKRRFVDDFQRIIQTKAYRRLADKTQAFSLPEHTHIRTRIIHTNEVIGNSIKASEILGLNTELCMAIAAGHDLGHVPYGHLGERVLSKATGKTFSHPIYGVVVAQEIENRGRGLNLCYETLEGMLYHSRGGGALNIDYSKPAEYGVVMLADKIAYTFSDYSDAANRVGYFPMEKQASLMEKIDKNLGKTTKDRRDACINALVVESKAKGFVSFKESNEYKIFSELRKVLYDEVYKQVNAHMHETAMIDLYKFIATSPEFAEKYNSFDPVIFISLLTDKEVTYFGQMLFSSKKVSLKDIEHFGAFELMPELKDKKIDYSDAGLEW